MDNIIIKEATPQDAIARIEYSKKKNHVHFLHGRTERL